MSSGSVIGVLPGCGGAGASVLASVIAGCVPLDPRQPSDVRERTRLLGMHSFLIDCDPLGGGIDVLLGCERVAGPRWAQVRLRGGTLDPSVLLEELPRWRDVSFLAADTLIELDTDAVVQVIDAAASVGTVVLDLPRWPSVLRGAVLSRCDQVVLVTVAEVRAVTASALIALELDPAIASVAVRGTSRSLPASRISELLRLPVIGELPYDSASLRPTGLEIRRVRRGTLRVASAVLRRCPDMDDFPVLSEAVA